MKIRNSFISNSSTSSFICQNCKTIESGMDIILSEIGFYECVNGHILCSDCVIGKIEETEEPEQKEDESDEDYEERCADWEENSEYIPETNCMFCQFLQVDVADYVKYIEKTLSINKKDIKKEIVKIDPRHKGIHIDMYWMFLVYKYNINIAELGLKLKQQFKTYRNFLEFLQEQ